MNLPVPPGSDGETFNSLIQHVIAPVGRELAPGLIVLSAGYDAHAGDPLADCRVGTDDYGQMTAAMRDLGRELGAPVLICLEGGYDVDALAASVVATIMAMGSDEPPEAAPLGPAEAARERFGRGRWAAAFSR